MEIHYFKVSALQPDATALNALLANHPAAIVEQQLVGDDFLHTLARVELFQDHHGNP